jgi:dTDP-4-dehydrorhamnose 3,5-epimerase
MSKAGLKVEQRQIVHELDARRLPMKFEETSLPGVIRIAPIVHHDSRGYFIETWQARDFAASGIDAEFVQENFSHSKKGTLRGLHYQIEHPQGRLVRVVQGSVFDVSVDLRRSSPTFGQWMGEILSAENRHQLWVPPGFGHGFLVLSETAGFQYNCTDYYAPEADRSIRWDDPDIGIDWPLTPGEELILSDKDMEAPNLRDAEIYP